MENKYKSFEVITAALGLFALAFIAWVVIWWPIYALIWLFGSWKTLIFVLKIKVALGAIIFLTFAIREVYFYWRISRQTKCRVYIVSLE